MIKILIICAAFLSGCATALNGSMQQVKIDAQPNSAATYTKCALKNEEGEWQASLSSFVSEPIRIHRDGNPMSVSCENEKQTGSTTVSPNFETSLMVMDIILLDACIISCIVDGANNAFYEYPDIISVPMRDK